MSWRGDISIEELDAAIRGIVGNHTPRGLSLTDKPCVRAACTRTVVQMVGRMCRTTNKAPVVHVLFDEGLVDVVDPYAMDDTFVGKETAALLETIAAMPAERPVSGGLTESRIASRGVATAGWLSSIARKDRWPEAQMREWEQTRLWCLENPCPTHEALTGKKMASFYVEVGLETQGYRYWESNDFAAVGVSFDLEDTEDYPKEVSGHEAHLDLLARIPEVHDLFELEGWPLSWETTGLLMNPAFFRNVYLGAIGEQAGKAILETYVRGLTLDPITNPRKFEKFDFVVSGSDVYVDFKNWHSPGYGGKDQIEWVREKMKKVEATHAMVVNLFRNEDFSGMECEEMPGNILSVPFLVNEEGCVVTGHVRRIGTWLKKVGALR